MLPQNSPSDKHILAKTSDYDNKVSILIGLLQFGRIFTEKANSVDEELYILKGFLTSAGLISRKQRESTKEN
ncbi:hypothetical protein niasHT_012499 [Heterodera trifolii]|uniref:Uncharacterized protein n=1 Tax=Heterodera trifolii TaxID=157864 RepID=A0ABD2LE03_9BILA